LFGVESEYAIASSGGHAVDQEELARRFMQAARRGLVHLKDATCSSGIFLENGSRLYIDTGFHPEMATPECTTPFQLVRYIKAGERILTGLTAHVQKEVGDATEVICTRCNVDYSGSGSTWGCHESYLHRGSSSLAEQLIPHLTTRLVYTGAGGFNPLATGPEFCVAPRLMHIGAVVSADSTRNRGIFHTKNEPLCDGGYHRLHILCGESLCSETSAVLKTGATAMVAALAEEDRDLAAPVRLADPLEALCSIAGDVTCTGQLRLHAGGHATALEIQTYFLARAERALRTLPPWAYPICRLWRETLVRLEGAPDSVSTTLDWAIKHRLFRDHAARRGLAYEHFPLLNAQLRRLVTALGSVHSPRPDASFIALLGPDGPIPEESVRIAEELKPHGLTWNDLERFFSLRAELYQIDNRFGQLGPRGIFGHLEGCGVLEHKVPGVGAIEEAMCNPPAVGRARIRGEAVRRLAGQVKAECTWHVVAAGDGSVLDLRDPFSLKAVWVQPNPSPAQGVPEEELLHTDEGGSHTLLDALRRRYGRPRSGAQSPAETSQSPGQEAR